jgi:eukaryotic-like serine/threonine-protein kinase
MPSSTHEGSLIGGRYSVRHLLGVGGSASVYEAEDTTFGRTVALKIPHENHGPSSVAAKRLVREARASGAVGHPNVCQVSEIGMLPSGTPFVVMERLVGETLRDRITNEGRLPFGDIVDIMMQVLSGLSAAHERGIIHRDIKPENIFLTRRAGCPALVKILDFGLVTSDQPAKEDLTAVGMIVGTPFYMAPEQLRGVRDFDARIDIYACGVVLYEATTGRRPFTSANQAELFREIVAASPTPASEIRRETPPRLADVISKAMASSPMFRFTSASAFQQALSGVQAEPPTPSSLAEFKVSKPVKFESSRSVVAAARQGGPHDSEKTRVERATSSPPPAPSSANSHSSRDNATVQNHSSHSNNTTAMQPQTVPHPPTTKQYPHPHPGHPPPTAKDPASQLPAYTIELSNEEDWDQQTEWDQPTLKKPMPNPLRQVADQRGSLDPPTVKKKV